MSDDQPLPIVDEPENDFAAYVATENLKEQAIRRGDDPSSIGQPVSDVPAVGTQPDRESAGADQGDQAQAPAEKPPEPDKAAKTDADERNADGTFKGKAKKVSNTGEWARNQRLTAELRQAQAELERLRSTVPASSPTNPAETAPQSPVYLDQNDPPPVLDRFLDQPDPYAALSVEAAKWAVREAKREERIQAQQSEIAEAQSQAREREAAFAADHEDYPDVIPAVVDLLKDRPAVLNALADDDLGPAVAYHLAHHPDEARRIAALTPVAGVREIGKLISRLTPASGGSGAETVAVSKAKSLIKPVGASPMASAPSPPDPETTEFSEWVAVNNRLDRKRREAMRGA